MKQKDNIRIRIMNSLTLTTIAIVLFCAIWGVFDKNIYQEVFRAGTMPEDLIWGSTAQDIITIFIAVTALLFTVFNILRGSFIKQVILLGCNWYFMYAYGLYVMQGQYTAHYPLYIAVFGLSIYAMIAGLTGIPQVNKAPYEKNKKLRFILSAFFIFIVVMLTPIWIAQMISDVSLRIPGDTYAVYIMDLAIVFPAFVISSFLLIKKNGFGIVLGGMSLIKIITLCLSWTFGEWTRPVTGNPVDLGMASISALLCFIGIILFLIYVNAVIKAEPVGIQN